MEKEKLVKIIGELKEVRTQTKSKVSDEVLFDTAIRIYNSEQIENNRQGKNFDHADLPRFSKPSSPATQSQKNLMTSLKIKYSNNITKKEAQKLISQKLR